MMITSRQLEAFRAIMARGTVTAAAERLGVSQPAVSKILAGLEHEIGYPLFTRIKRRLAPTSEARLLEQEVTRLYHSLERVTEVAREIRERQMDAEIAIEEQRAQLLAQKIQNDRQDADGRAYAIEATLRPLKDMDWKTLVAASARGGDPKMMIALAFRELAENATKIGELNMSPDLLQSLLGK